MNLVSEQLTANFQNKARFAKIADLQNSQSRADIELIISVDHTRLTLVQRRVAKKLGLITREMLSLFQRAKNDLSQFHFDTKALQESGKYEGLTNDELAKLDKSAKDKLRAIKMKGQLAVIAEEEEEKNLPDDGPAPIDATRLNHVINTFFDEFNLDPTTTCLKRQNAKNQVAFYQYILSLAVSPDDNFLQMLSHVIAAEAKFDQKLRLFHGFCTLYDGKWIGNFDQLCVPAVQYFAITEQAVTNHALGFLRYVFVNGIDLPCSVAAADAFDLKFAHVWGQLANLLRKNTLDSSMFKSIPHTILIMRAPMMQALKNTSLVAIPPDFFKTALRILTYSCISDQSLFQQLLFQFKDPLTLQYNAAESMSFITLCQHLEVAMKTRNKQWFAKPSAAIDLLKNAHEMIRLNKVPGGKFTSDVCTMLLATDLASKEYLKRPSHKKHQEIAVHDFLNELIALNSSCKETASALQLCKTEKIEIGLSLFKHLLLQPSPIQKICIQLLQLTNRAFLCPQTGTGKTTLMNALATEGALQGNQVIIVNPFSDLLFKDYATLRELVQQMKLAFEVQLLINQGQVTSRLCFLTFEQLLQVQLPPVYHLIIDEFQEQFYSEKVFALLPIL